MSSPIRPRTLSLVLALGLAFGLAGCETLEKINPFGDNKKPLPGDRQPVFPQGVPGVTYSGPVAQPSNSNIPLTATITPGGGGAPRGAGESTPGVGGTPGN